jgi:hypothetical protein
VGVGVLRVLGVGVVLVVLAEIGVRALADNLPSPSEQDSQEVVLKEEQLDQRRGGPATDVAFVGSSNLDAAIDPVVFREASGSTAYNAALLGTPAYLQDRWIEGHVLPALRPTIVVVGITPFDVVHSFPISGEDRALTPSEQQLLEEMLSANLDVLDDSALGRLDHEVSSWSELVRRRAALRSPTAVWDAALDTIAGRSRTTELRPTAAWEGNLSPDGAVLHYRDRTGTNLGALADVFITQSLTAPFVADRVREPLQSVDDAGAQPVLVVPPIELTALQSRGLDVQGYRDLVAEVAATAADEDVPIVDFTDRGYGPELFADIAHLNGAGSTRFSTELAASLLQLCADGTLDACP